jgi:hypothetical protein
MQSLAVLSAWAKAVVEFVWAIPVILLSVVISPARKSILGDDCDRMAKGTLFRKNYTADIDPPRRKKQARRTVASRRADAVTFGKTIAVR